MGMSNASSASTPSLDSSLSSPTKVDTPSEKTAPADPYRSPDFYTIRVSWGDETEATEVVIMYKSIMLSNRDHTREVICSAMMKHGVEGNPDDFTLSQLCVEEENLYGGGGGPVEGLLQLDPRQEEGHLEGSQEAPRTFPLTCCRSSCSFPTCHLFVTQTESIMIESFN